MTNKPILFYFLIVFLNVIFDVAWAQFHHKNSKISNEKIHILSHKPLTHNHFKKRMIPRQSNNFIAISNNNDGTLHKGQEPCSSNKDKLSSNIFYDKLSSTEIGQKASNIAFEAAQEAKEASEAQQVAGQEAAHLVKAQLAERAIQAARAAEAALAGKQAIVEQLEHQIREVESAIEQESQSLQQAQSNVNAALLAAEQAGKQVKTLTTALQIAQAIVGNSEKAAQGAQQELAEKTTIMEASKNRVEELLRKLNAARSDLNKTKQAAYKASQAAHEAKVNATRNKRMLLRKRNRIKKFHKKTKG